MRRGFKAEAEHISAEMRRLVGLSQNAPMAARKLAKALDIVVMGPKEIPGIPEPLATQMLFDFGDKWSGVTIPVAGQTLIIVNTGHSPARQESDLMHEIAHILCKHKPARIDPPGELPWASRSYDREQETQAAWLGGCLQIPRSGLMAAVLKDLDNLAIGSLYGASPEMVSFRRNTSGVDSHLARRKRYAGSYYRQ
jgi:Zn-dependent peptidase ImmA (M78 family)